MPGARVGGCGLWDVEGPAELLRPLVGPRTSLAADKHVYISCVTLIEPWRPSAPCPDVSWGRGQGQNSEPSSRSGRLL